MIHNQFVLWLAVAKENYGYSISHIAKISGVSKSTIHRILYGVSVPNIDTVDKILRAFGYKLTIELKGGDGK